MKALDADGVSKLMAAAGGTELEHPIGVASGTGLRRGELLALRWADIDLRAHRLAVRRSLETVKGVTRTKPPKTAKSARTIFLPLFVVEILRLRKAQQLENLESLGLDQDEETWVFTGADERAWEPGAFSLDFARFVKRAKLPHVRFHDLRHSFGTLALAAGVDLKTVSTALGHSTISMTANIYVHAVPSLQDEAAARIDALLGTTVLAPMGGPDIPVPLRCHAGVLGAPKPYEIRQNIVAPTGVEPVSQP